MNVRNSLLRTYLYFFSLIACFSVVAPVDSQAQRKQKKTKKKKAVSTFLTYLYRPDSGTHGRKFGRNDVVVSRDNVLNRTGSRTSHFQLRLRKFDRLKFKSSGEKDYSYMKVTIDKDGAKLKPPRM